MLGHGSKFGPKISKKGSIRLSHFAKKLFLKAVTRWRYWGIGMPNRGSPRLLHATRQSTCFDGHFLQQLLIYVILSYLLHVCYVIYLDDRK
jgi:hypothetical protein